MPQEKEANRAGSCHDAAHKSNTTVARKSYKNLQPARRTIVERGTFPLIQQWILVRRTSQPMPEVVRLDRAVRARLELQAGWLVSSVQVNYIAAGALA